MYLPSPFRRSVPKRLDAQIAKRSVCLGDVALCNGAGWLAGWLGVRRGRDRDRDRDRARDRTGEKK
jgi:hypothetical protein